MEGKKEVFWQVMSAFLVIGIIYIGSYALLSNQKISSKLDSVEDQIGAIGDSVGYQSMGASVAGSCSSINFGKVSSDNEAELHKLAQALSILEESGLGWNLPYNPVTGTVRNDPPIKITSSAHISDPLFRIKYHHGIIPEGGAWVGTRQVDIKTINKINELLCNPLTAQIVFSSPYSLGKTPNSNDGYQTYQQKGLLDFRWNYYKISADTTVSITIENDSTKEKTIIASNLPIAPKIYNWEIPADITPGLYKAYIKCEGTTACEDKIMGLFEIKETPALACTNVVGYIDFTQNSRSRWNTLYREWNNCSTAGLGESGARGYRAQFCKNYKEDVAKMVNALIMLPESQYYSGQKSFGSPTGITVNMRKAIQNFQLYHDIYTSDDAKFGYPDVLTRRKIKELTCAQ